MKGVSKGQQEQETHHPYSWADEEVTKWLCQQEVTVSPTESGPFTIFLWPGVLDYGALRSSLVNYPGFLTILICGIQQNQTHLNK